MKGSFVGIYDEAALKNIGYLRLAMVSRSIACDKTINRLQLWWLFSFGFTSLSIIYVNLMCILYICIYMHMYIYMYMALAQNL